MKELFEFHQAKNWDWQQQKWLRIDRLHILPQDPNHSCVWFFLLFFFFTIHLRKAHLSLSTKRTGWVMQKKTQTHWQGSNWRNTVDTQSSSLPQWFCEEIWILSTTDISQPRSTRGEIDKYDLILTLSQWFDCNCIFGLVGVSVWKSVVAVAPETSQNTVWSSFDSPATTKFKADASRWCEASSTCWPNENIWKQDCVWCFQYFCALCLLCRIS